jgi:hypothetical protein
MANEMAGFLSKKATPPFARLPMQAEDKLFIQMSAGEIGAVNTLKF